MIEFLEQLNVKEVTRLLPLFMVVVVFVLIVVIVLAYLSETLEIEVPKFFRMKFRRQKKKDLKSMGSSKGRSSTLPGSNKSKDKSHGEYPKVTSRNSNPISSLSEFSNVNNNDTNLF